MVRGQKIEIKEEKLQPWLISNEIPGAVPMYRTAKQPEKNQPNKQCLLEQAQTLAINKYKGQIMNKSYSSV